MTLTDSVLQLISEIHIPGFFITTDFLQTGEFLPQGIDFSEKNRHKAQRKAKFYINKCRSASCMQGGLKQASA